MPPQTPPLDIVAVAIALASLLFKPEIAQFVGPYAVIFLGAILGGAMSAARRGPATRAVTLGYMALVIILALLVTVPLAEMLAPQIPVRIEARVLFAPVAAIISGIGQDWPKIGAWIINLARGVIERRVGAPPNDVPPGGPAA